MSEVLDHAPVDLDDEAGLFDEGGAALTLPQAEKRLLGCMLFRPAIIADVRDIVNPEDFSDNVNRRLFEGLVEIGDFATNAQAIEWLGGDDAVMPDGMTAKQFIGHLIGLGADLKPAEAGELAAEINECAERRATGNEAFLPGEPLFTSKMGALLYSDRSSSSIVEADFLVEDLIPENELVIIMGEKQTGKSFVTTHLGFSISRGVPFFNRRVLEPRPVIWCCYEGGSGARRRMIAYANHFDVQAEIPFAALTDPFDLWQDEKNVDELIREIEGICRVEFGGRKPGAVIIDTHNAATTGASEIDSEVVSKIRKRYEYAMRKLGCSLIIVGHTNAIGKHRGNEQLANSVPTILTVSYKTRVENRQTIQEKDNDGRPIRTLSVRAQREGETGDTFDFVLHGVETGIKNKFGKMRTSCVVAAPNWGDKAPSEDRTKSDRVAKTLGPNQLAYFKAFWEALQEYGELAPPALQVPRSVRVVKQVYVNQLWNKRRPKDLNENTAKSRRQRAETWYQNKGILRIDNDHDVIWWTGKYVADLEETYANRRSKFDDASDRDMLPNDQFEFPGD